MGRQYSSVLPSAAMPPVIGFPCQVSVSPEPVYAGDPIVHSMDERAQGWLAGASIPCPFCHQPLKRAPVAGRAVTDGVKQPSGEFLYLADVLPSDYTAIGCADCHLMFYLPTTELPLPSSGATP